MTILNVNEWNKRVRYSLKRLTTARSLILMYHRVESRDIDPWSLTVTPEYFAEHLKILKKHTQPMRLRELAEYHKAGKIPERAVAVTFDDGYANNLYVAKPLLDEDRIPATVFISTGYTEKQTEFWWDELDNIVFQPGQLPEKLCLKPDGNLYQWELGKAVHYTEAEKQQDYKSRVAEAQPETRMWLYHSIWQVLCNLRVSEREKVLSEIKAWANYQPIPRPSRRPMTPEELSMLERTGWIEIGAHTVNHVALSAHSVTTQKVEIEQSKAYLEKVLDHPVTLFSYPFGVYNPQSISIVKKAGFMCACSTAEETVWKGCDRFLLPRFSIYNWSGLEFEQKLLSWLES